MMILKYPGVYIKAPLFDYFFVFMCVIFLGGATVFTAGGLEQFGLSVDAGWESLVGKFLMIIMSLYLLYKYEINIISCFDIRIVLVLILWGLLQVIKYRQISPYPIVRLFNLYFASVLIFCYRKKLLYYLEDIIAKLALIDFVFWIIMILMPEFTDFLMSLSPIENKALATGNSWVVFAQARQYELLRRNVGFAWEPGRFGTILAVAVFFNLIAYKFKIRGNYHLGILTLAILSSQSTTAYIIYIIILFVLLYNKRRSVFFQIFPMIILAIIFLMRFDFMYEKIYDLSVFNKDHIESWNNAIDYYSRVDRIIVPQRFDGLKLEALNILHDPFIGNATDIYGYLYSVFYVKFSLSNGALRIFANMGIIIGLLYYYLVYKSSIWMSKQYKYQGSLWFLIIFIMINVSYSWIFEPVFLSFVLYPFLIGNSKLYQLYRIKKILHKKFLTMKFT